MFHFFIPSKFVDRFWWSALNDQKACKYLKMGWTPPAWILCEMIHRSDVKSIDLLISINERNHLKSKFCHWFKRKLKSEWKSREILEKLKIFDNEMLLHYCCIYAEPSFEPLRKLAFSLDIKTLKREMKVARVMNLKVHKVLSEILFIKDEEVQMTSSIESSHLLKRERKKL